MVGEEPHILAKVYFCLANIQNKDSKKKKFHLPGGHSEVARPSQAQGTLLGVRKFEVRSQYLTEGLIVVSLACIKVSQPTRGGSLEGR